MKYLFVIISFLFIGAASQAQFTSARLTAAGLTCAMCTKAIYTALEHLPLIDKVDADIKNSAFVIEFKKDAAVDPDALKAAVEEAGFSVAKLTLTGNFDKLAVKNDEHVLIGNRTYHFLNVQPAVLSGTNTLTLVDKNYVSDKLFKKYVSSTDMTCVKTGTATTCCAKEGLKTNARIYHVTI